MNLVPRWLRIWSTLTVVVTAALLALGTVVTSFRVGMADPVWPTEPWRLLLIDWTEPSRGFLIEHAHRLAGFTAGGVMALLALSLWWTEPARTCRWGGLAALVSLLATFGYLHGVLIRQTKQLAPGAPLEVPAPVAGVLLLAVALVLVACAGTAFLRNAGWGLRLAGVALLVAVMVQGLLGGLRVHWHVRWGETLSVAHAAFSQFVFALVVLIALACHGVRPLGCGLLGWSVATAAAVYAQVVLGALVRHTAFAWAPRLHLLVAFAATVLLCGAAVRAWAAGARRSATGVAALLVLQLILGVEAWMVRFGNGFARSALQPITEADAGLRSAHAVAGYVLFALAVALAYRGRAGRVVRPARAAVLEGVG
jgi:hypothetical protein